MIPKIIHHIAPANKNIWPNIWQLCHASSKYQFDGFEHKLWNDEEDIDNLVKDYYPQFYEGYTNFSHKIMKIDFVRFCIMHKYGGIFMDMDIFVYKNFYGELDKSFGFLGCDLQDEFVNKLFKQYKILDKSVYSNKKFYCANGFTYSEPENQIWMTLAERAIQRNYVAQNVYPDDKTQQVFFLGLYNIAELVNTPEYIHKAQILDYKLYDPDGPLTNDVQRYKNSSAFTKHVGTGMW